ncbi:acyltransferase family protein [Geodermatophilus marinus]|uniref:acyltransferase family protein n=1 Tax=Geodermatophilus sp. LHW52908 TaxID=2303986 RepID=UPI000E3DF497|nr:acyltransferase [Geodermatophilus sp. LHW52908]RFU20907.1 acyltransferase [Geodermatophilus sp. LHW52908]
MTSTRTDEPARRPAREPARRPPAAEAGSRVLDLDVVRGVAIVLALGWHFSRHPSGFPVLDALQWPGGTFGWAGVDLFFVLSGFLVGSLVLRERRRTGRFDGRRFTVRRALKLWPVLYLFLAVQLLAGSVPWDDLWHNALHVQNYLGTPVVHLWSLAVEEHFYLALVVLFPLVTRWSRSVRPFAALLCGVLVAALALRVWGTAAGLHEVTLQWRTHFRADSLAFGVLLAVVAVHRPATFDRLLTRRRLWAVLTLLGVAWLATIGKDGALGSTLGYTVAYLTAGAFLLLLHRAPLVARVPAVSAPLAALGRYSYGVYIWHIAAAQFVLGRLPGVEYASWTPLEQVLKYAAAVAVGIAATLLVERPVLRVRDRLLPADGRRADTEAPTSGWGDGPAHPVPRHRAEGPALPLVPERDPVLALR